MAFICKFNDLPDDEYLVDFNQSGHVVTLTSASERKLPEDNSGFRITREDHYDDWNYSDYNTVYRVLDNGMTLQLSNDGSVYVPPTKDVIFQAVWFDQEDAYGVRPTSVDITIYCNGKKSVNRTLTAAKNWKYVTKDRPAENVYTITADDVEHYEKNIDGSVVTYSLAVPQPREITQDDIAESILEIANDAPLTYIKNIYASYCEKNLKNFNDDVPAEYKEQVNEVISSDLFMVNEDGTTSLLPINETAEEE